MNIQLYHYVSEFSFCINYLGPGLNLKRIAASVPPLPHHLGVNWEDYNNKFVNITQ